MPVLVQNKKLKQSQIQNLLFKDKTRGVWMSVNNLQMDIFIYNFFTIINLHFFLKVLLIRDSMG